MNVGMLINKHVAIAHTGVLFFIVAGALSAATCRINRRLIKPKLQGIDTAYVLVQMALLCIVGYYSRRIVRSTPYIFDGLFGYEHARLKELNGGVVIAYAIFAKHEGLAHRVRDLPLMRFIKGGA